LYRPIIKKKKYILLIPILIVVLQTQEEGHNLLLEIQNNFKGYDFENRLNVRVHAALRNIG
jgi:hypothetical protein